MAMEKTNFETYRFMINLHLSHVVSICFHIFFPSLPRFLRDFLLHSLPTAEAATKDSSRKRNAVKDGRGIFFSEKSHGFFLMKKQPPWWDYYDYNEKIWDMLMHS